MTTPLSADDKSTMVMVYTNNSLLRGEVVTKENVRVSIWLRTEGAPKYLRLLRAQVLFFGGGAPKSSSTTEAYVPVSSLVAFHLAPPLQEPMDYEEGEKNRAVQTVSVAVGTFIFKGKIRFSAQTGLGASLEMAYSWMSMYDTEISNPNLPQMPAILVPMLLVNPTQVTITL
jgi:hypothetical protein